MFNLFTVLSLNKPHHHCTWLENETSNSPSFQVRSIPVSVDMRYIRISRVLCWNQFRIDITRILE